jgi:hypothetical protein
MTEPGRADLHLHSLASDGLVGVSEILAYVEAQTDLDVIAITDHDRIDAALAAQALARERGLRVEVIVGEEITTRGGHLLGLFLSAPIPPWGSLRASIAAVHAQGGLAIPAHPLVPVPISASARALRHLLADPDPAVHPDGLETFNPSSLNRRWRPRVADFVTRHELAALGGSDAHRLEQIDHGITRFPGHSAAELRAAILARTTWAEGAPHSTSDHLAILGQQTRKYVRDRRDDLRGLVRRDGSGRDLGYPSTRRYAGREEV